MLKQFNGIHRFLFEDLLVTKTTQESRTKVRDKAHDLAYSLLQRCRDRNALIVEHFGDAVRLSIPPQDKGSGKLYIRLGRSPTGSAETCRTPWHSVALETKEGFILCSRSTAVRTGGRLQLDAAGRPSYYGLAEPATR